MKTQKGINNNNNNNNTKQPFGESGGMLKFMI